MKPLSQLNGTSSHPPLVPLGLLASIGFAVLTLVTFHLGYLVPGGWPILLFPLALLPLLRLPTSRAAFYTGLGLGLALYAPHLGFFYTIFGPVAGLLWLVLAFWLAVFLGVGRSLANRLPTIWLIAAIPTLWLGLEYFRSELYYLRFSWLNLGYALSNPLAPPSLPRFLNVVGIYGLGFLSFFAATVVWFLPHPIRWLGLVLPAILIPSTRMQSPSTHPAPPGHIIEFAGAQTENAPDFEILGVLDRLAATYTDAQIFILPEYAIQGEPDLVLRDWCRRHQRHLILGGRQGLDGGRFHNTAFVIGPTGDIVFRQAKSVPIQFFDDGVPASSQSIWKSPWGAIGLAICYDLSYSRVIDGLVRAGAEALIVPTMDTISWGAYQHALHARIAPTRAVEYGLPIVRIASSGISQGVDRTGCVTTSSPFSEETKFIHGTMQIGGLGSLPIDRFVAPAASGLAGLLLALSLIPDTFLRRFLPVQSPRS